MLTNRGGLLWGPKICSCSQVLRPHTSAFGDTGMGEQPGCPKG